MIAGMVISHGNQAALERCQRDANKAGEPVQCTVKIEPTPSRSASACRTGGLDAAYRFTVSEQFADFSPSSCVRVAVIAPFASIVP